MDSRNLNNNNVVNGTITNIVKSFDDIVNDMKAEEDAKNKFSPCNGETIKISELINKKICILSYDIRFNGKDSKYYYIFDIVYKDNNGKSKIAKLNSGCFEIKQVCNQWKKEKKRGPIYVTIGHFHNSYYFKEYHKTDEQVFEEIVQEMNIDLTQLS